ncbi:sulfonate ABC transporter substrate-binding protein, partial [Bradyrhizobium sp. JYMT SZCCT0428]|nr:sulfonate ABC transporter substrate-binding protein [Bradyrhizobium sp. JYMT SZCCT0428]
MSRITRRALGFATLAGLMLVSAAPSIAVAQEKVVRMGNQKVGAYALMKARGILEERL